MGMVLVLASVDGSLGLAWGLHTSWVWVIVSLDSIQMINYTGIGSECDGKNGKPLAGSWNSLFTSNWTVLWLFKAE